MDEKNCFLQTCSFTSKINFNISAIGQKSLRVKDELLTDKLSYEILGV